MMLFLIISLFNASGERKINCSGKCLAGELQIENKTKTGNTSNADYQLTLLPGSVMLQY